jgi:hypothetical protein
VDGAEAGGGEGGEDARVRRDRLRGALAAAQSGGDQVEGVAAVGLGAGGAPGGAAVAAADQEVTGGEVGRLQAVEGGTDFAGGGVDAVFRAMAGQAYGVGAAAQSGELSGEAGQSAGAGEVSELGERDGCAAGDDGSLLFGVCREGAGLPGRRDAWRYRGRPGGPSAAVRGVLEQ